MCRRYAAERYLMRCISRPLHIGQIDAFFRHFVQRRKLAQAFDGFDHAICDVIDFGLSIETADAEANRAVSQIVARAQSLQYIRWLQSRRSARRTAGNCYVVNAHQQRFALDVREADVQIARKAMLPRAVDVSLVQTVHDAVAQTVAQAGQLAGFPRHFFLSDGASFAQADYAGNIQCPGTHAPLVSATVDDCRNLHSRILAAYIQRSDALRTVHLVTGDRCQVDILLHHVDRNFADCLRRVSMENHSAFVTKLTDFRDGLDHADLVVRVHD